MQNAPDLSTQQDIDNFHVVDHPLIQHKLSMMRDKECSTTTFRMLLREISLLIGYEITRELPMTTKKIETPLTEFDAPWLEHDIVVVPILRAGLGMADGLHELMPAALTGHIGLYRDAETKKPVEYLVKLPEAKDRLFILVDPMLATGNSAAYACDVLNRHGIGDENIRFLALVSSPEGVKTLHEAHPKMPIYTAALDDHLNEHAYIVPGLGDAGDRLYGTI